MSTINRVHVDIINDLLKVFYTLNLSAYRTVTEDKIIDVQIKNLPIRLGQFLKVCGYIQDGSVAKLIIQNGEVEVNRITETRRGKKLSAGDIVKVDENIFRVVGE